MQLLTIRLGDRQLAFAPTNSTRLPFSFPAPVDGVYALLQTCYLNRIESDKELREMRVSLQALFDPLQSRTDGEVQVDFQFTDAQGFDPIITADLLQVEIGILVVGV